MGVAQMFKTLTTFSPLLLCLAACIIGPATASAANKPVLTQPTGTVFATGVNVVGNQLGESTLYSTAGNKELDCSTATITGTLLKNAAGTIEGQITSAIFGGTGPQAANEPHTECTGTGFFGTNSSVTALGLPWCIRSTTLMAEDEFQISGGKCGGVASKIQFTLLPTGFTHCIYQATQTNIKGTFTTDIGQDAVLTLVRANTNTGFSKTSGNFLCPSSTELEMSFTLQTDTVPSQPIFISKLP
jgi:hypothetical protein